MGILKSHLLCYEHSWAIEREREREREREIVTERERTTNVKRTFLPNEIKPTKAS